jgi:hypothetical protein
MKFVPSVVDFRRARYFHDVTNYTKIWDLRAVKRARRRGDRGEPGQRIGGVPRKTVR